MLMPGARTLFGTITITGEQQVKEKAIRRQLTIDEGLQYSKTELGASADAIYGLGMFQAVTPRLLNLEEEGAPLNVEIEMRERQPHSFQFGFGYSTVERFRGQVQWLHRNLWGGAEQLTLSGKISSIEQKFEARLHLPYLWNRHTSFTQTLFVRNEQEIDTGRFLDSVFNIEDAQPAFDLFSYGGEARLEHQFTKTLSGFGGLSLSQNDFSNVNTAALTAAEEEVAQDNLLLVQFAELLWRTSDSLLNPTRGIYLSGRVDHSNASLLSDVSFIKLTLEARHYQRLWDGIILATRLKVGSIEPYGVSTAVPFNVLFFAGGPGSVRGFALNRLGPMNAEDDPIGGNSLLEGSVEVRFPIVGKLGGALFIDGGNVFQEAFTYRLNELRYAVGPGVRYDTPIGPIRLDLGLIVNRRSDENFGRVEFSIGQAF
jgi:outer membrane protein assembly complex protein YaeT